MSSPQADPLVIAYASRWGTTATLAADLADALRARGRTAHLHNISDDPTLPAEGRLIVMTAIVWDRPIPAMRQWIATHRPTLAPRVAALVVVCGAAGVRPTGGQIYARQLARRIGVGDDVPRFALSGQIPEDARLKGWERVALRAFAKVMRAPGLMEIEADRAGVVKVAGGVGE